MKNLCIVTVLFLMNINSGFAQDDANCGIVIDEILVDNIDCWDIKDAGVIFPVSPKWKNFDIVQLKLVEQYPSSDGRIYDRGNFSYVYLSEFNLDKPKVNDWFKGANLAFWKVEINGQKTAQINSTCIIFDDWAWDCPKNSYIVFQVLGYTQTGMDAYGKPKYNEPTVIYQTRKYPITGSVFRKKIPGKGKTPCTESGKKVDLKFEAVQYRDDLFITTKK